MQRPTERFRPPKPVPRIGVFVDDENLKKNIAKKSDLRGWTIGYRSIIEYARARCQTSAEAAGSVVAAYAYVAVPMRSDDETQYRFQAFCRDLEKIGFTVRCVPTKTKRLAKGKELRVCNADVELAADAGLHIGRGALSAEGINELVLFTGDGDFAHLLDLAGRERVFRTVVAPTRESLSGTLERERLYDELVVMEEGRAFLRKKNK